MLLSGLCCPIRVPPHPLCPSSRTVPIWFDNLFWWKSVVFFPPLSSPLSALAVFTWSFPAIVAQTLSDETWAWSQPLLRCHQCLTALAYPGGIWPCTIGSLRFPPPKIGLGDYWDGNVSVGSPCHCKKRLFHHLLIFKIWTFFTSCFILFILQDH